MRRLVRAVDQQRLHRVFIDRVVDVVAGLKDTTDITVPLELKFRLPDPLRVRKKRNPKEGSSVAEKRRASACCGTRECANRGGVCWAMNPTRFVIEREPLPSPSPCPGHGDSGERQA